MVFEKFLGKFLGIFSVGLSNELSQVQFCKFYFRYADIAVNSANLKLILAFDEAVIIYYGY